MADLVETVARAIDDTYDVDHGGDMLNLRDVARAAIAATLDEVERNLSAVQYDPAPYTALKHRLAAIRARGEA